MEQVIPSNEPITVVTTEGMAYGPHAVARKEGKVLFVRGAAPGEKVAVAIREDRGAYAYAELIEVLHPSSVRRTPPCPYLPRCGGCPWQHIDYSAQLVAKHVIVHEHIRRIARANAVVHPVLPSPSEFGYRQRLKLRVVDRQVGFFAGGTHSLVAIERCLLAAPEASTEIPALTALVARARTRLTRVEVAVNDPGSQVVVGAQAEGGLVPADEPECQSWLSDHPTVCGLALRGHRWQRSWGEIGISVRPEADLSLRVHPGTFTQVNREANRVLVALVVHLAGTAGEGAILDLYAGAGNFSLPLARRGVQVLAVDSDRCAVEDGKANARRLGVETCRFECATAARAVAELAAAGKRFTVAILDPPRSGAAEVLKPLVRLAPKDLIYVSCDPSTLARDLGRLAAHYRIQSIQPLDLFPQTYHVETVVHATLI